MTTASASPAPVRWTSLNITLHWTIVALLVVQFFDSDWMNTLFDQSRKAGHSSGPNLVVGYLHMIVGGLIFLAAGVRLWDHFLHGRPPHDRDQPNWAAMLARATHAALYAILLAMPIAGALAWFSGSDVIAQLHGLAWTALMVVAGLHVVGALANHLWFRNDVLRSMMPGQGRHS